MVVTELIGISSQRGLVQPWAAKSAELHLQVRCTSNVSIADSCVQSLSECIDIREKELVKVSAEVVNVGIRSSHTAIELVGYFGEAD
jgi:hypothetical protein